MREVRNGCQMMLPNAKRHVINIPQLNERSSPSTVFIQSLPKQIPNYSGMKDCALYLQNVWRRAYNLFYGESVMNAYCRSNILGLIFGCLCYSQWQMI